jgi:hypothetical protein
VICTGKKGHAEARIAMLGQFVGLDGTVSVLWKKGDHPDPLTGWRQPNGSRTFRFQCPRCPSEHGRPRDARLHEDRVIEAMEAIRAAGAPHRPIDISVVC